MIVTFYSFKGGVGRSFALLETAAQLARRGRSVVVWDLDLEAPGLQKIPVLRRLDEALEIGTLDLLLKFQTHEYRFPDDELRRAILDLSHDEIVKARGRLSFLLPGKLGPDYARQFGEVDWPRLFAPENGPGPAFFHKVARVLTEEFQYELLLIDSRTGYTDLGALCTIQLPDLVTLVFNLNEQNLEGIASLWAAVTSTPARHEGHVRVVAVANMIPVGGPADPLHHVLESLRLRKINKLRSLGIHTHVEVPLRPELLLTDEIPSLDGRSDAAEDWRPLVEAIEAHRRALDEAAARASEERIARARARGDERELDVLRRRGIYEKAKTFEERVADLFHLLGYQTIVGYEIHDMRFDLRLEMAGSAVSSWVLVECKDTGRPVTQEAVREFAGKVEHAQRVDRRPYQAVLVARSRFANNAHAVADERFVQLRTFDEVLRSLVDLGPTIDRAIREFQGSPLERLYVEQDVVLDADLQPGGPVEPLALTATVLRWLDQPGETFFALLGDFGSGKTSFCKRLACQLAVVALEGDGKRRIPVLIDLREARSTTVSLENILTHHFQALSSRPFNPQALLHLNREGHLVLIFDGFDEMLGYSEPGQFAENLRQIMRAAEGRAKVLLTCRTHYFRDRPDEVQRLGNVLNVVSTRGSTRLWDEIRERPDIRTGYLREFTEEQIQAYLRKAIVPPADWRAFREEIRRTYNLEDLAERPFLLEVIVKTLPRLARDGGGVTIGDLYEAYCEEWFDKTDFRLTLTRERKVVLVEYLARLVWETPEARVHYQVLAEKAAEFFSDRSFTAFEKEKIDYEVRTALFLSRDAAGYYVFIHRSFLEFFVARTLRHALAARDVSALDLRRLTPEVAYFLECFPEAAAIPEVAAVVLAGPYRRRVSENALLLLYWHARARFGSLVRGAADKREPAGSFARVREAFREMRPPTINLAGADLSAVELAGIDLRGATLAGADLSESDVSDAALDDASLIRAKLAFAELNRTTLSGADLSEADLSHVEGREAGFEGARLRSTILAFAHLVDADLRVKEATQAIWKGAGLLRARMSADVAEIRDPFAGLSSPRGVVLNAPLTMSSATSVAWSPDGLTVASTHREGTLNVWDAAVGRLLMTLDAHAVTVWQASWDPMGMRLASASDDHTVKVWEVATGRLLMTLEGHADAVLAVTWDPAGTRLASASDDNTVKVWEVATGRLLATLEGHGGSVCAVDWDAGGGRLASASDDKTVRVWEAATGRLQIVLEGHADVVNAARWDPAGTRLASASNDGTVNVWDGATGRLVMTMPGHAGPVWCVSWDAMGARLASASADKTLKMWDAATGRLLTTLEGHVDEVNSVSWDPGGGRLASASDDASVEVWDAATGQVLMTLQGDTEELWSMSWDPSGARIASASGNRMVNVWEVPTGRLLTTLEHAEDVWWVSWDPTGQRLALTSEDGTLSVWEMATGRRLMTMAGHAGPVWCASWDPSGARLASASADGTVKVWDASTGRLLTTLEGHEGEVNSVSWDPAGERLASASDDQTVKVWQAATARVLATLRGHTETVGAVAWDPAGTRLASASYDNTVKLWEPATGRLLMTLEGHVGDVVEIGWDPTGSTLASASEDKTVRLWDVTTGRLLTTLEGHLDWVIAVGWDSSGSRLASASFDGSIRVFDCSASTPRLMARLFSVSGVGGVAITPDGDVAGDPAALALISFADRWALYSVDDMPERVSSERVAASLRVGTPRSPGHR